MCKDLSCSTNTSAIDKIHGHHLLGPDYDTLPLPLAVVPYGFAAELVTGDSKEGPLRLGMF